MYMVQGGQSAFPRSAAGIVALYSAGIYEGEEISRGLDYLQQFVPRGNAFNRESGLLTFAAEFWQAGATHKNISVGPASYDH